MSPCSKNNHRGFTLVELLVVIGIMTVILSIVLSSQNTYTDSIALSNFAEDLSLTVSQAQAYGIAVKELVPGSSIFYASYGISMSLLDSGSKSSYILFADRNGNQYYDGDWSCPVGGNSECLKKVDISQNNYIDSFCILRSSGGDICNTVSRVDISFLRPNTNAQITVFNSGGQSFQQQDMTGIKTVLKSPGGATRYLTVYLTGQVSVQ